jgi:uncharacterized lipoprotein YajG
LILAGGLIKLEVSNREKEMKTTTIILLASLLLLSGCAMMTPGPQMGLIITDIKVPMTNVAYYGATSPTYSKMGEASCTTFLGLFSAGNAGIYEAMKNGGIVTVNHISYRYNSFLFLITKYTTVVYGE